MVGPEGIGADASRMSLGPLSGAIGSAHLQSSSAASGGSVAAVNDQIRQDKQQLDDWTTCVSAKTTKGQAEIQRLSAALGGAESRAHRLAASESQTSAAASSHSIDVWV